MSTTDAAAQTLKKPVAICSICNGVAHDPVGAAIDELEDYSTDLSILVREMRDEADKTDLTPSLARLYALIDGVIKKLVDASSVAYSTRSALLCGARVEHFRTAYGTAAELVEVYRVRRPARQYPDGLTRSPEKTHDGHCCRTVGGGPLSAPAPANVQEPPIIPPEPSA